MSTPRRLALAALRLGVGLELLDHLDAPAVHAAHDLRLVLVGRVRVRHLRAEFLLERDALGRVELDRLAARRRPRHLPLVGLLVDLRLHVLLDLERARAPVLPRHLAREPRVLVAPLVARALALHVEELDRGALDRRERRAPRDDHLGPARAALDDRRPLQLLGHADVRHVLAARHRPLADAHAVDRAPDELVVRARREPVDEPLERRAVDRALVPERLAQPDAPLDLVRDDVVVVRGRRAPRDDGPRWPAPITLGWSGASGGCGVRNQLLSVLSDEHESIALELRKRWQR